MLTFNSLLFLREVTAIALFAVFPIPQRKIPRSRIRSVNKVIHAELVETMRDDTAHLQLWVGLHSGSFKGQTSLFPSLQRHCEYSVEDIESGETAKLLRKEANERAAWKGRMETAICTTSINTST